MESKFSKHLLCIKSLRFNNKRWNVLFFSWIRFFSFILVFFQTWSLFLNTLNSVYIFLTSFLVWYWWSLTYIVNIHCTKRWSWRTCFFICLGLLNMLWNTARWIERGRKCLSVCSWDSILLVFWVYNGL